MFKRSSRYLSFIIFIWVFSLSKILFAQSVEPDKPTKFRPKRLGRTEIGYNFFLGKDAELLQNSPQGLGSIKFNWATMQRFYAGNAYFSPGLGFAINEWRFQENIMLEYDKNKRTLFANVDTNAAHDYGKSKFQLIYLRLPLEVGLQFYDWNVSIGSAIDLLIFSKHKRKYEINGKDQKDKITGNEDFRTNSFQFMVNARIDYRGFGVYFAAAMNPLFQNSITSPDVHSAQAGIYFISSYKNRKKKEPNTIKT